MIEGENKETQTGSPVPAGEEVANAGDGMNTTDTPVDAAAPVNTEGQA